MVTDLVLLDHSAAIEMKPKRRKGEPAPSLSKSLSVSEKEKLKVFKLDVFGLLSATFEPLADADLKRDSSLKRQYQKPIRRALTRQSNPGLENLNANKIFATFTTSLANLKVSSIEKSLPDHLHDPSLINKLDISRFKDTSYAPPLTWKGHPLLIDNTTERYDDLTKEEIETCITVRLLPIHYLYIKEILLRATIRGPAFKKRDAQGWFRIDVNKINKIYDWFVTIGWIPACPETWDEHVETMMKEKTLSN